MTEQIEYELKDDKPGYGRRGERIRLHPRQAEYLLLGGVVAPVDPPLPAKAETPPAPASPARTRRPST